MSRCHRQLAEIIVCLGKTFCNSNSRIRRTYDNSTTKNALLLGEMLFSGAKLLLQLRDSLPLEQKYAGMSLMTLVLSI